MQIIFQAPSGSRYSAELVDDRLTDIKQLDDDSSPSGSGGSTPPPMGESEKEPSGSSSTPSDSNSEPKENEEQSGGASNPPAPEDRVFIEKLQAVLVNNRARKQLRNKQKGSLDLKALVRTQTNSQSVFKQNNRKDSHRNYSVMLLVDESGSMSGPKAQLAQELASNISTNLERVGGVEVAVIGFAGNRVIEHKRFDNSGHSSLCCIADFTDGGTHCNVGKRIDRERQSDGQNADLIAMEYSLDYLRKNQAPDSRPIFIMLSDGEPCGSNRNIAVINADLRSSYFESKFIKDSTSTREISSMHRLLERYPEVNAFGLGMLRGGQQVPKHKVVKDIRETKGVLLEFLQTSIQ